MLVIILSSPGSHLSLSLLLYSLFLVLLVYFLLSGRQNIFHCGKSDCDTVLWIISLGSMLWFSVLFISGYFARLNYSGFGNQLEFDSCHAKKNVVPICCDSRVLDGMCEIGKVIGRRDWPMQLLLTGIRLFGTKYLHLKCFSVFFLDHSWILMRLLNFVAVVGLFAVLLFTFFSCMLVVKCACRFVLWFLTCSLAVLEHFSFWYLLGIFSSIWFHGCRHMNY